MKIELQDWHGVDITFWMALPLRYTVAVKEPTNEAAMKALDKKVEEISENGQAMEYWAGRGFGHLELKVLDIDDPEITLVLVDHLDDDGEVIESHWLDEDGAPVLFSGNPGTAASYAATVIQEAMFHLIAGRTEVACIVLANWLAERARGHIRYAEVEEYVQALTGVHDHEHNE